MIRRTVQKTKSLVKRATFIGVAAYAFHRSGIFSNDYRYADMLIEAKRDLEDYTGKRLPSIVDIYNNAVKATCMFVIDANLFCKILARNCLEHFSEKTLRYLKELEKANENRRLQENGNIDKSTNNESHTAQIISDKKIEED